MPAADLSIVHEVVAAINIGSAEKQLETIKRVTDLFLSSAGNYDSEQIELFDNVLERLVKTIEIRAIADVSARFPGTSVGRPPPCKTRRDHHRRTHAGGIGPSKRGRSCRSRANKE